MSELKQSGISDNAAGALAYITVFPAIAFLVLVPYKKNNYVRFHAWQSIFLNFVIVILATLLDLVISWSGRAALSFTEPAVWLIALLWAVLWVYCAFSALNGKIVKLPIIGKLSEKQANG